MKKLNLFLSVIMVACLIFSVSCISKQVEVTETYYETEIKREPYMTTEEYEIKMPHSTTLYKAGGSYSGEIVYLLFNKDTDGNIRWASVSPGNEFPLVKTFKPEPKGQNHRISVVVMESQSDCPLVAYLSVDRDPEAQKLGFNPIEGVSKALSEVYPWLHGNELQFLTSSMAFGYVRQNTNTLAMTGLQKGNVTEYCVRMPDGTVTVYKVEGPLVEFPFEDMFQRDQWAFIQVFGNKVDDSGKVLSDNCLFNVSVDYVWDDVSIGTREVTKYRESPIQVEKQRTVTQTKKVPFWEGTLH